MNFDIVVRFTLYVRFQCYSRRIANLLAPLHGGCVGPNNRSPLINSTSLFSLFRFFRLISCNQTYTTNIYPILNHLARSTSSFFEIHPLQACNRFPLIDVYFNWHPLPREASGTHQFLFKGSTLISYDLGI